MLSTNGILTVSINYITDDQPILDIIIYLNKLELQHNDTPLCFNYTASITKTSLLIVDLYYHSEKQENEDVFMNIIYNPFLSWLNKKNIVCSVNESDGSIQLAISL